jgi:tetratricopeptide (TPR) repeat protein
MDRKIYLKQKKVSLGCGSTAKAAVIEDYYQVVELDKERVEIRLLDMNGKPFGSPSVIPKENLRDYIFCPDYLKDKKSVTEPAAEKRVQMGDAHYEKKEYYSAEHEYNQALAVNENHLRAHLGKGKALMARGEKTLARKIFSNLSKIEALFHAENKHTFNELGIELRKEGLFEDAMANYQKAISIDPEDEILRYNLERAYFEMGNLDQAVGQLKTALSLSSDFVKAQEFLRMIQKQ